MHQSYNASLTFLSVVLFVCFQEGMRQHYELGGFLRNRYKGFLNESYDRHEVDAFRSHDTSAESHRQTMIHNNNEEEGAGCHVGVTQFMVVLRCLEYDGSLRGVFSEEGLSSLALFLYTLLYIWTKHI